MLVGVFLAIVAFVGILLLTQNPSRGETPAGPKTTGNVVVAVTDIPLSTRIKAEQVTTKEVDLAAISVGAFRDPSQVIGQIARETVGSGAQITASTVGASQGGQITNIQCPVNQRCIAVQVDQLTGVGAVIKTGDYVDMILGLAGDQFPVVAISPSTVDSTITIVGGINGTSVKVVLQGLQVMGTLLPPVAATPEASPGTGGTTAPGTALSDIQEIVVLSVTAQQAEVIRFAQISGAAPLGAISLVLRSTDDFIDPITNLPLVPVDVTTTGIILKTLVDSYGVLPPEVIQAVLPSPAP